MEAPWWWAYIVMIETHVQGIHERAGWDPEKMVAPKNLWPLDKSRELEEWYDSRDPSKNKAPTRPRRR